MPGWFRDPMTATPVVVLATWKPVPSSEVLSTKPALDSPNPNGR
jgi:hypothetical protein